MLVYIQQIFLFEKNRESIFQLWSQINEEISFLSQLKMIKKIP